LEFSECGVVPDAAMRTTATDTC